MAAAHTAAVAAHPRRRSVHVSQTDEHHHHPVHHRRHLANWSLVSVFILCMIPATISFALWLAAEFLLTSKLISSDAVLHLITIAFLLHIISVPVTHEISGKKAHSTWHFYQPLKGGLQFIVMQFLSWGLFVCTIVSTGAWVYQYTGRQYLQTGLLGWSGLVGFLSELLMIFSIRIFDSESSPKTLKEAMIKSFLQIRQILSVGLMSNMSFVLGFYLVLPWVFLPFSTAVMFFAVTFLPYLLTYRGHPASTGSRRWSAFKNSFLIRDLISYFHGNIVKEGDLEPGKPYIFAFAPHGVFTLTAIWCLHHPLFKRLFPGQDVIPLGASIYHYVPLVRDPALWLGSRQVTKSTFIRTLEQRHSVLMVPGGMAEMKLSHSDSKTIQLYAKHKGFIRLALQHGVDLVPTYSFGETLYFDLIRIPYLSDWMVKHIQSPVPYFTGLLGWIQFPRPTKVTVVFGKPIQVPKIECPTQEDIDAIHAQFYASIRDIFERNKEKYGHGDYKMELVGLDSHSH